MAEHRRPRCECCDEVLEELLGMRQNFEKFFHRFNKQIVELRREFRTLVNEPKKLGNTSTEVMSDKNIKRKAAAMYSQSPLSGEDSDNGATSSSNSRKKQSQSLNDVKHFKQQKLRLNSTVRYEKNSTPKATAKRPVLDFFGIQLRVLPANPFNTDIEFEQWDSLLLDDEDQRDHLRVELLQGHFDDAEQYIMHIWSSVLGDGAKQQFSYKGNVKTNKKAVKDMIFTSIFKECFLQRYEQYDSFYFMGRSTRFFNCDHDRKRQRDNVPQASFEKVHIMDESTMEDNDGKSMDAYGLRTYKTEDDVTGCNFVNINDFDQSGFSSDALKELRKSIKKDLQMLEQRIKNDLIEQDERLKIMLKCIIKGKDFISRPNPINKRNIDDKVSVLLPTQPFTNIEDFKVFEEQIKSKKDNFVGLVQQLEQTSDKNAEKFIRNCWRKLLADEAAQHLCWKGTDTKLPVRGLIVTSAIKTAAQNNFLDSVNSEFDKTCILFFQHAKNRFVKRLMYQSKSGQRQGAKDEEYSGYIDESQNKNEDVEDDDQITESLLVEMAN